MISGDAGHENEDWPIVLVAPCSSESTRKVRYCVKPGQGIGNVQKKCRVRAAAVQPIAKDDLGDCLGQLPAHLLEDIHANSAEYTGQV